MLLSLGHQVRLQSMRSQELADVCWCLVDSELRVITGPVLHMKSTCVSADQTEQQTEACLLVTQEMAAAQRGWFMPASAAFEPLATRSGYRASELLEVGTCPGWRDCWRAFSAASVVC